MGIFGYGQKDFEKNTASFKESLMGIMTNCGSDISLGRLINQTMVNLDMNGYPKGADGKKLQAVDTRIQGIINMMWNDVQKKKPELLSAHAVMLASAVSDARKFGKEFLTPKELEAEMITAECKAQLFDTLNYKEQTAAKMAELLEEAKRNPARLERIKLEYNDLAAKTANIDKQIQVITARHNANIQILNTREIGKTYTELPPQIATVQEFNAEVAKINKLAAQEAGYVEGINDAAAELDLGLKTNTSSTAFDDAFAASQMSDFDKAISGASVGPASKEASPFDAVFGQKK